MTAAHNDIASSRPIGVAQVLGGVALDEATVFSRPVVLTGEHTTLLTRNGQWCLLDSLRLLSRIVGPLTVVLPAGLGEFEEEVQRLAKSLWTRGSVFVVSEGTPVAWSSATAILNVGARIDASLPWSSINSNGWVARVSSGPTSLPMDSEQSNPLAALMAASLGATEVFKRVYGIPRDTAPLLDATQFSLFELSAAPTTLGPSLPPSLTLPDTVMVGGGAIGNGIALLLSQLALRGRLHIIDKQTFQRENLGTCVVLDDISWIGFSKATQLAGWLDRPDGLRCTGEEAFVEDARSGTTVRSMAVDLVLNGLDDIGARHDAQRLWPSVLVDGGINAVGAAVTTQRLDHPEGACMICSFRIAQHRLEPPVDRAGRPSSARNAARLAAVANGARQDHLRRHHRGADARAGDEHRSWIQSIGAVRRHRIGCASGGSGTEGALLSEQRVRTALSDGEPLYRT
jgi:hypothetical protein